jgi:pyruvate dehydrogenase E1 component beta subunit
VVAPTLPYEAKGLLISSIEDNNPVIFIEHRWLFNQIGIVPEEWYSLPLGKANIIREGKDITIVTTMDMVLESIQVAKKLESQHLSIEIINLCSLKPIDEDTILKSVAKTGRLLIIDSSWVAFGISAEVAAIVSEKGYDLLKSKIKRLGLPDAPAPTTWALSKYYYTSEADICNAICEMLDLNFNLKHLGINNFVKDVPDEYFKGPF